MSAAQRLPGAWNTATMRGERHLKDNEAMTIELTKEQQRMVDLAVASGTFHNPYEVIRAALAMLYEDIEDGIISDARAGEPRFSLDEVEAELRALGKIK
jgi:Arc/MetJ-type ribon-helix-helix transcriptional regulator